MKNQASKIEKRKMKRKVGAEEDIFTPYKELVYDKLRDIIKKYKLTHRETCFLLKLYMGYLDSWFREPKEQLKMLKKQKSWKK